MANTLMPRPPGYDDNQDDDISMPAPPGEEREGQAWHMAELQHAYRDTPVNQDFWDRNFVPFLSPIVRGREAAELREATARLQSGRATRADMNLVALHRERQRQESENPGQMVATGLARGTEMAGESMIGGAAFRAIPGAGYLAGRSPVVTGAFGGMGVSGGALAANVGRAAAGRALMTPLMPSLYAERAGQTGNLGQAMTLGAAQNLVLGTLQPAGRLVPGSGVLPFVSRTANQGIIGAAESTGIGELARSIGLQEEHTPFVRLALGQEGAGKDLAIEVLTFAAFAAAHGQNGHEIVSRAQDAFQRAQRRGSSEARAAEQAAEAIRPLTAELEQFSQWVQEQAQQTGQAMARDRTGTFSEAQTEPRGPEALGPLEQPPGLQGEGPPRPEPENAVQAAVRRMNSADAAHAEAERQFSEADPSKAGEEGMDRLRTAAEQAMEAARQARADLAQAMQAGRGVQRPEVSAEPEAAQPEREPVPVASPGVEGPPRERSPGSRPIEAPAPSAPEMTPRAESLLRQAVAIAGKRGLATEPIRRQFQETGLAGDAAEAWLENRVRELREPQPSIADEIARQRTEASDAMEKAVEAAGGMNRDNPQREALQAAIRHFNGHLANEPAEAARFANLVQEAAIAGRLPELMSLLPTETENAIRQHAKSHLLDAASLRTAFEGDLQTNQRRPGTAAQGAEGPAQGNNEVSPANAGGRQAGSHELTEAEWERLKPVERAQFMNPRTPDFIRENLLRRVHGALTLYDHFRELFPSGISRASMKDNGGTEPWRLRLPESVFTKNGTPLDEVVAALTNPEHSAHIRVPEGQDAEQYVLDQMARHYMIDTGRWAEREQAIYEREKADAQRSLIEEAGFTPAEAEEATRRFEEEADQAGRSEAGVRAPAKVIGDAREEASDSATEDLFQPRAHQEGLFDNTTGLHSPEPGGGTFSEPGDAFRDPRTGTVRHPRSEPTDIENREVPPEESPLLPEYDTTVDAEGNLRDSDGNVLFGPQSFPTGQASGSRAARITPFEIVDRIKREFDFPANVERPSTPFPAYYLPHTEAAVFNKQVAGEVPIWLHEVAHHIDKRNALPLDPATLPADVAKGFRQFDYLPNRQSQPVAMKEGFAEWLRRREMNELFGLTPEQKAAAEWAEMLLTWKNVSRQQGALVGADRRGGDLVEKLDRIKDLFEQYRNQTSGERYGGLFSRTGDPARKAGLGESAADLAEHAADAAVDGWLDDLAPAKRAEAALAKKGAPFAPGERLSEVMAVTRFRNIPDAHEMAQGGMFGYDPATGRRVQLGRSERAILEAENITAADIPDLERLMKARRDVYDADVKQLKIPPTRLRLARETLNELQADLPRYGRLERTADAITAEVFDASLAAMVMAGRFTPEQVAKWRELNPLYISTHKISDPDWKTTYRRPGARHGEEPRAARFAQRRSGESGEEEIGLLDAMRQRREFTAYVLNDQAKFQALLRLAEKEGAGQWVNPGKPGEGGQLEPWPRDGTKPSVGGYVNGEPWHVRINDRPFYEMYVGLQGQGGGRFATGVFRLFQGLGDLLQATRIPQAVRVGGTVFSHIWHAKNWVRDPIQYIMRTRKADLSPVGTNWIRNMGELMHWWGKAYSFYGRALLHGGADNVEVRNVTDNYFKIFERMVGRELSIGAVTGERTMATRVLDGWHGFLQRLSDTLTGQERGTRVLEMKNRLDSLGYTKDWIAREMAKNPNERNPIPFAAQVAALEIASQITHNVHQQGYYIRELNRSTPFLGAHIAGVYKDLSNFRVNPKKALTGLAILAAAKAAEWLANKDDPEWNEFPDYLRYGFSFKTPMGWIHLPAPRGAAAVITGLIGETMRATSNNNPRFAGLMHQALEEIGPRGGPEPFNTLLHVTANRSWTGRPIIPQREADTMSMGERLTHPRGLAYEASQLTGGMLDPRRLRLNPFGMDQNPRVTVDDYYARYRDLSARRSRGARLPEAEERTYQKLQRVHAQMTRISQELRGFNKSGRRLRPTEMLSPERRAVLIREQVRLAHAALHGQ